MPASKAARVQASVWSRSTPTPYVSHEPSAMAETSRSESPSLRRSTVAPQPTRVRGSPRGVMTTLPAREPKAEPPERTDRAGVVEPRPSTAATPAGRVLALQRQAGNRAVTALLARDPTPNAPPAKAAPASTPTQLIVPDVGSIPL